MDSLIPHIYYERQESGSMMCGNHCLNNLLQVPMFDPASLCEFGRRLDRLEQAQMSSRIGPSNNYDDTGYFSLGVMESALEVLGLKLVRWGAEEMRSRHANPELMEGFILNHSSHWYTLRSFGPDRWYLLDSMKPAIEHLGAMYLGLTMKDAENRGYSIFAVVPAANSNIQGLPPCDASTEALKLAPPTYGSDPQKPTWFTGIGNVLGKRSSAEGSDEENPQERSIRPKLNSTEGEDFGGMDEEEEAMARAIAESLMVPSTTPSSRINSNSNSSSTSQAGPSRSITNNQSAQSRAIANGKSKAELEEEEMMEMALKASMMGIEQPSQEDDSPTVDELRARRLARFG